MPTSLLYLVKERDNKFTLPRETSAVPPTQMKLTADEVFEINKRKKNVIISGLPETGNDTDDFFYFANTYHSLPTLLSASHIHSANRLGLSVNPQKPIDSSVLLSIRWSGFELYGDVENLQSVFVSSTKPLC